MFPQYTKKILGTFEIVSGRMAVSDPCYKPNDFGYGVLRNVKKGVWEACVMLKDCGEWGVRVAGLRVRHQDAGIPISKDDTRRARFMVGVDSGQAGFFDEEHYDDSSLIDSFRHNFGSPWYNRCCDLTLGEDQAGVLPYGAVSSSGYGDGGYDCRYKTNADGEIDYARIEFID